MFETPSQVPPLNEGMSARNSATNSIRGQRSAASEILSSPNSISHFRARTRRAIRR